MKTTRHPDLMAAAEADVAAAVARDVKIVAAAEGAAFHAAAYIDAYVDYGLTRKEAFRLYCLLAARPQAATQ